MVWRWIVLLAVVTLAGCQSARYGNVSSDTDTANNFTYLMEGQPLTPALQSQLVRWIGYSGGELVSDPAKAKLAVEVISDEMLDRTISVNALGQPSMCEKTAKIIYRVSILPDRESSAILIATTSMLYRRENDRQTSFEYQATRLHEKLSEDISRYVGLQLTAWNRQHAIDY